MSEIFASALTLDTPRARKTLEHLIAHPEEHNQMHFGVRQAGSCGTTMCIAGTTVYQDSEAGGQVQWWESPNSGDTFLVGPDSTINCGWIEQKATELLGLSYYDAQELFFEWDNQAALSKLSGYIDAAEKAQADAP